MLAKRDGDGFASVGRADFLEERDGVLPHGGRRYAKLFCDVAVREPT